MDAEERPEALFIDEGDGTFVPTAAAAGPWVPGTVHGAAVAGLLAGLLEAPDSVMARVLVEMCAPVPSAPLVAVVGASEGGRRVQRQSVSLLAGDRVVAKGHALRTRRGDIDVPADPIDRPVVFDPGAVPDLSSPIALAGAGLPWPTLDTIGVALRTEEGSRTERVRVWLRLLLPVVSSRPASAVERVAVAADYAQTGTNRRVDYLDWTFINADLTVSLGRPPAGEWFGLECDSVVGSTGTGQSLAAVYDVDGPLGQVAQCTVIERRE